jgi:large subunit ribosomal protein L11
MLKSKINILAFAGTAKPNPKLGQALGPLGINMAQFCKDFNAKSTHFLPDTLLRVKLSAFDDRTYTYLIKPPPTSWFIKKCLGKERLSGNRLNRSGTVGIKYIYEIAKVKKELDHELKDISLESICRCIIA